MRHGELVVLSRHQRRLNALGCPTGKHYQETGATVRRYRIRRKKYLLKLAVSRARKSDG